MPFDVDAPFQGPDGAPNHKPYSKALTQFANLWEQPSSSSDPPSAFYGRTHVYLKTEHDQRSSVNHDALVTQPMMTFPFQFIGNVSQALSSGFHIVPPGRWECIFGYAAVQRAPAGSITVNFEYKGQPIHTSAGVVTIPNGAASGVGYTSATFALSNLVEANPLDLFRPLRARIVQADSGDNAADLTCGLVCRRLVPAA